MVGGVLFDIYDTERVLEAAWIGLPALAWPGIDLGFGPDFWALLPAFVMLTLVGAMDTIGDCIAIQRISWRRPRAIDFQSIQGALAADGVGNLLSGLMGTMPNTTYVHSIAVADLTRVTARVVGICVGIVFVVLAFLPKLVAVIVAMPGPVAAAYYVVIVSSLFVLGVRVLMHDGLDHRKGVAVGLAFWLGLAFELDWIFPEYLQGGWGELLANGLTVGGVTVIVLTQFVELTGPRARRLKTELALENFPRDRRVPVRFRRAREAQPRVDRPTPGGGRGTAAHPDPAEGRGRDGVQAAPAARRARRRRCGRARVRGDHRRREPGGPARPARRAGCRSAGRGRGVPAPAAPLRVGGAPSAIPRHGRGHGPRGAGRRGVSRCRPGTAAAAEGGAKLIDGRPIVHHRS